jgi:FixJ family two-component response regulator
MRRKRQRHLLEDLPMEGAPALISVVDDDESVRESLPDLLRECGYAVEAFASAEQFLASGFVGRTACLVLDIAMPGMSGPELKEELERRGHEMPIIFITAQSDEALRWRLLARGAVGCLLKPFSESALLGTLHAALSAR